MTTRKNQKFHNDDQYNTTPEMWQMINHLIPKDKILWEGFMKDNWSSTSAITLRELGHNVIGDACPPHTWPRFLLKLFHKHSLCLN